MRGSTALDFLAASPLEVLEVGGQVQVHVLLIGELLAELVRLLTVILAAEALASEPTDGGSWVSCFMC